MVDERNMRKRLITKMDTPIDDKNKINLINKIIEERSGIE